MGRQRVQLFGGQRKGIFRQRYTDSGPWMLIDGLFKPARRKMDEQRVCRRSLPPGSRRLKTVGMSLDIERSITHHHSIGVKIIPAIPVFEPAAANQRAVRESVLPPAAIVQPAGMVRFAARICGGKGFLKPCRKMHSGKCQRQTDSGGNGEKTFF